MFTQNIQKFFVTIGLLLFAFNFSLAQKVLTFHHIYGISPGTGDYGNSILALPDKGFILGGAIFSNSGIGKQSKILLRRTDSLGRTIWSKTYEGKGLGYNLSGNASAAFLETAVDLILSPEGNIVVCSGTFNIGAVYLFKIRPDGKVLWSKTFPGNSLSQSTLGLCAINAPDGGYLLTGASSAITTHSEAFAIKTDTAGNLLWSRIYSKPGFHGAGIRAIPSLSGGYFICGISADTANGANFTFPGNYLIMKIDNHGKLLWSKVYSHNGILPPAGYFEAANSIIELPDKSIYVIGLGMRNNGSAVLTEGTVIKMDSTGNILWSKIYFKGNNSGAYFNSAIYDSKKKTINISCNFDTTITFGSINHQVYPCGAIKLDTSGKPIVCKAFGLSLYYFCQYNAAGHNFIQLPDGDFLAIQSAELTNNYQWNSYFIKMDSGYNSDGCNSSVFAFSDTAQPLHYLYNYRDTSINLPEDSTGYSTYTVVESDSLFCAPFVADFGYLHNCATTKTLFYDSSYAYPVNWQWDFGDPASGTSNTSTSKNPDHTYSKSGTYTVKLISGNGTNKDSLSKKVIIYPLPVPISFDTLICKGAQIALKASGGSKYRWYPDYSVSDSTAATVNVGPATNMQYIVIVKNIIGCAIVDTFRVNVDPLPDPPVIRYTTVKKYGEIDVVFHKSDSNDVKTYTVFRKTDGGPYTAIATIKNTTNNDSIYTFADKTVSAAVNNYYYKIVASDSCGATSDTSIAHKPVLLKGSPGERRAFLTWTKYQGYAYDSVILERYDTINGQWIKLTHFSVSDSSYADSSYLKCNKPVHYRIATYLRDGLTSYSDTVRIVPFETVFKDTPQVVTVSKLNTSPTNGSVIIRWNNKNSHVMYNRIYYSTNGNIFNLLKDSLKAGIDSFVQTGVNTRATDGWYYVEGVDSCPANSPKSITHKTITLTVSVGQLLHRLNWTPYEGYKVKKYNIEKSVNGKFQIIDSVPGTDTSTKYFPAPCNSVERYQVEAVGYHAGEVSFSDTMGRKALDTVPSDPPLLRTAVNVNNSSEVIGFKGSDSLDTYDFIVQRSTDGNWATAGSIPFTKPGQLSSFADSNINTKKNQICYTIIARDSCLNATSSDTICAINLNLKSLYCSPQVSLNWTGCTNPTCPDSYRVYRSEDGVNFNTVAALKSPANTLNDNAVNTSTKYYYKIEAINSKKGYTSISDTLSIIPRLIPEADSAQLVYATVLKTDQKAGEIYVQWKRADPSDTNARGYYVYSLNPANGKYALLQNITDLNDTIYINSGLNTLNISYKYYIVTYNVCDVGINSNIHKTILLKVTNNDLNTGLAWNNYLGVPVKSYSVYKSADGGVPYLLNNTGLDSVQNDSNIYCGHSYTYQIQAMLANGEISFSDSVTIKAFDTIKPQTKPIIVATVTKTGIGNGQISLSWHAAMDKNLAGYDIYRSGDGIHWIEIQKSYPDSLLIDTALNTYNQPYYYKIQPVDSCGNLGGFIGFHETINLKTSANNGFNKLYWNVYKGWRVKYYLILRDGKQIDSASANTTNYKDSLLICNNLYHYVIEAVCDSSVNIFSFSNMDSTKAINHNQPQKVYLKTVSVSSRNKAVTLSWSASASYDVKDYLIYRKSFETGNLKLVDTTSKLIYTDSSQRVTDPDCYYVFVQDHCGNLSDASNNGCIIILNAKNQPGYNTLNWNGYQTWNDGVQDYNVYKNEDSTGWQLIGTTTNGTIHDFADHKLGDSTIDFCYRVVAVENPGQYNQLSRSTVTCIHQDATIFIPNTFSHYNLDGLNDYFAPKGLYIKNYAMQIYNRWGELMYSRPLAPLNGIGTGSSSGTGGGLGWDGTFRGQDAQKGVYIYLITIEDYNGNITHFKGNVTIFE